MLKMLLFGTLISPFLIVNSTANPFATTSNIYTPAVSVIDNIQTEAMCENTSLTLEFHEATLEYHSAEAFNSALSSMYQCEFNQVQVVHTRAPSADSVDPEQRAERVDEIDAYLSAYKVDADLESSVATVKQTSQVTGKDGVVIYFEFDGIAN